MQKNNPSLILLIVFGTFTLLSCCGGGGLLAWAVSESESAGVSATYVVAFPACFSWAGLIGAGIAYFAIKESKPLMIALPIGLALAGGIIGLIAVVIFFVAIFPAL